MRKSPIRVSKSETIFTEGEIGESMYVVVEGQVQIVRRGAQGPVVLATLDAGAFFGEMAIVDPCERTATAVAATDTTLMVVYASEIEELIREHPDIGVRMFRALVRRLKQTTNQVMDEKEKIAVMFQQ